MPKISTKSLSFPGGDRRHGSPFHWPRTSGLALILATGLSLSTLTNISLAESRDTSADMPGTLGIATGLDALRWQGSLALDSDLRAYAAIGAKWLRTDLNWSAVQQAGPDSYDWSSMDRIVAMAEPLGLRILPVVGFAPDWAGTQDGDRPALVTDPATFARFLTAAVARYKPFGIRTWEIWNEPNLAGFWPPRPDPAAYAQVLKAGYAAIKAADPGATVLAGGLSPAPATGPAGDMAYYGAVDFLAQVYAAGGKDSFDALAFHPYSYPLMPSDPAAWNGWRIMTGPIRDLMIANGDGAKKIWITEFGAPTNTAENGVSDQAQADMLVEAHRLASAAPWAGPLLWYSYRDLGADRSNNEDWFGLIRASGAPKPSLLKFRALAPAPE